ncbi:MAG: aminoacyl-histidine dipeptidase [Clostridia bacterium]|nr:aminoacyl-histidine dipeptidase [Clostridia bacterium]
MNALLHCKPHNVFAFFEEICAIPHGSGNVTKLADWCVAFAKQRKLRYLRDDADNVILFKDAAVGYEQAKPIILQGHLDMVCATAPNTDIDLSCCGITPLIDGEWIRADGTTLGGDNGIAVAMLLAILDDDTLPHPPLEVVLTSDEEVGLLGAHALDTFPLRGRRMINLDSEEEGVFTVSCAGGVRADCTLPITREDVTGIPCKISVLGLTGGHSGVEIHKGRANAHVLISRLLYAIRQKAPLHLLSLHGGEVDNAIAIQSTAEFLVAPADLDAVNALVTEYCRLFQAEYHTTDPALRVTFESGSPTTKSAVSAVDGDRLIAVLRSAPNGVQAMSPDIPNLVQTSLNFGILRLEESRFSATFSLRSSLTSQKDMLKDTLRALFEQSNGTVTFSGDYPGWAYRSDSPLRELVLGSYRDLFGTTPTVSAIHAGLECGIFASKLEDLDCISFGPDMQDVHTPQERLHIASCERIYQLVLEILKRCKA